VGSYEFAQEGRLEPEIAEVVRARDYVLREYRGPGLPPIALYVAAYGSVRELGAGAHDPRLCYPAQGWEVLISEPAAIPLDDGPSLRVEEMVTRQERAEELVLFWIQPAERWPGPPALEQLLGLVDAISRGDRYAFVRLSAPSLDGGARTHLREFARELAPHVRGALQAAPPSAVSLPTG
jgi:EpsI family protein